MANIIRGGNRMLLCFSANSRSEKKGKMVVVVVCVAHHSRSLSPDDNILVAVICTTGKYVYIRGRPKQIEPSNRTLLLLCVYCYNTYFDVSKREELLLPAKKKEIEEKKKG
jgi:hypothetical protein